MTEEKFDRVLTAWARDYVAGKSLPESFSERLRLSVRRSRRAFKVRLTILIALIAATGSHCGKWCRKGRMCHGLGFAEHVPRVLPSWQVRQEEGG